MMILPRWFATTSFAGVVLFVGTGWPVLAQERPAPGVTREGRPPIDTRPTDGAITIESTALPDGEVKDFLYRYITVKARTAGTAPTNGESTISPSSHWVGISCDAVSETLRSQLRLPVGEGLVVQNVVKGSPAEQAGLQQHDILCRGTLGEREWPLAGVADLTKLVGEARDAEFQLTFIRGGERLQKTIKAAKRPEPTEGKDVASTVVLTTIDPAPVTYTLPAPFAVRVAPLASIPSDVTVTISRTGNEPAKIAIKKGDTTFHASSLDLAPIPAELRPYAGLLLPSSGALTAVTPVSPEGLITGSTVVPAPPSAPVPSANKLHIRKLTRDADPQLELLQKELAEIRAAVEKLQQEKK